MELAACLEILCVNDFSDKPADDFHYSRKFLGLNLGKDSRIFSGPDLQKEKNVHEYLVEVLCM